MSLEITDRNLHEAATETEQEDSGGAPDGLPGNPLPSPGTFEAATETEQEDSGGAPDERPTPERW